MRSAIAWSSPGGTRWPVLPSRTASRAPPTSVATTGRPAAMYSTSTLLNPSDTEIYTHTSEIESSSATRWHRPVKCT
jgi:hypothetical protein